MLLSINKLNKRQEDILAFLSTKERVSVSEVFTHIQQKFPTISKITVHRDLKTLVKANFLVSEGAGRGVVYVLSPAYILLKPIDVQSYFSIEIDKRQIRERFHFDLFTQLKNIFSVDEKKYLQELRTTYQKKILHLTTDVIHKEFERFTVEMSWKSSSIEGNTYSLLETEQLLLRHKESSGHTKEEAMMIINHKKALDYIRLHGRQFLKLSPRNIEEVHTLLTDGLGISRGLRGIVVGITGTAYKPLDNRFQIQEALEKACTIINKEPDPFVKAFLLLVLIPYVQPFVDGNKRTSRLMGNAVLLAFNCCPLSYRTIDEVEYKKAILLFYEQNNISYMKKLFLQQVEFVVHNYF